MALILCVLAHGPDPVCILPLQFAGHLQYNEQGGYFPIIHFNEFWLLRDYMIPMNETVSNVTLHLELGPVSSWWWQMMLQMDKSFGMQKDMGLQSDGESDELKRVFLEGNPVLLVSTSSDHQCLSRSLHKTFI